MLAITMAFSLIPESDRVLRYGYRVLRAISKTNLFHPIPSTNQVSCGFCSERIAACASELPHFVIYDGSYQKMEYPMGDIAPNRGVCSDVVIRTLRCAGLDLQVEINRFRRSKGLKADRNNDHRRVRNIGPYLEESPQWKLVPNTGPYEPGDLIWWKTPGGASADHIGVFVTDEHIVHNQGYGVWNDARASDHKIHRVYRLLD